MNQIEVVRFSQIANRLPEDCWAEQRNQKGGGELAEEKVLHIPGDATFHTLDLDEVTKSIPVEVPDGSRIFLIFVEGNLTVERWMGNDNTDAATNLIVKGDLQAENALLGGQRVYVCGDMSVEDILWGGYNHGDLTVEGTTAAGLFIATDQYHFDLRGDHRFGRQLIEEGPGGGDWELLDFATLSKLIEPDCLLDDANLDHVALMRDAVLDRLESGEKVLLKEGLIEKTTSAPSLFDDRNITIDNILKVADPKRMPADLEGRSAPRLEFWAGDTLCRATAIGREDEFGAQRLVYLQDDNHAVLFTVVLEEDSRSLWQRLSGKPLIGTWRMSSKGRRFHADGDEDWHVIEPEPLAEGNRAFPEEFHSLLASGWNALLDGVSTYDHASTLVSPDEIRRLLALPVVEPYDDFYGDTCGFWTGRVFCAFRQEGALYNDTPQSALLRVNREYTHVDGRDLVEMYFFSIRRQFDGTESVFITYKDDQDSDAEQLPISFLGGRRLELARRAFNTARRNLDAANHELIEDGIPPDWEDGFAVKHWRKKGLIRLPAPSAPDRKFAFIEGAVPPLAGRSKPPAIDALFRRLEALGFREQLPPPIIVAKGLNSFFLDAEGEHHLVAASIIGEGDVLTLDVSFYFDADDWGQVRPDIEKAPGDILEIEDWKEAPLVLPDDLGQLGDLKTQWANIAIELTVPEREPDQTFEIVTLTFTGDLSPKDAPPGETADAADASGQNAFLQRIGWHAPELPAWQISIALATRPPIEWTTKRNALQPDDMWLSLTLSSFLPWTVRLERHDRLFIVDWTESGTTIESEQLRYRKIMKWPEIAGPTDFPRLVGELSALFPATFSRAARIIIPKTDDVVKKAFADWLSDVCDTIEFISNDE